MFNLCRPGGRVVGMGSSPFCPPEKLKRDEKYGRFYTISDDYLKKNGTKYLVRIVDSEADLDITLVLYWYSPQYYEDVFKKIGFTDFKWVPMTLSGDQEHCEDWRDFLDQCTLVMYEAKKPVNA